MRRRWLVGACLLAGWAALRARAEGPVFLDRDVAAWTAELRSNEASVRRSAAFALGRLGAAAAGSREELAGALRDPDPGVRDAAAFALGEIGEPTATILPALRDCLGDAAPPVRRSAAYALSRFHPPPAEVCPALVKALHDPAPMVRQAAAFALGQLRQEPPWTALGDLRQALTDPDPLVRRDTAAALGELGQAHRHRDAQAAPPGDIIRGCRVALLERYQTEADPTVRQVAIAALVNFLGPEDAAAIDALRRAVQDPDRETARAGALALANVGGPRAVVAVPVLADMAAAGGRPAFLQATGALLNLFPAINSALRSTDPAERAEVATVLQADGALLARALPAWLAAVAIDQPPEVRLTAARALVPLTLALRPAVPALLRTLRQDTDPEVRHLLIGIVGRHVENEGVLPVLEAALREPGPAAVKVRYAAAEILAEQLGERAPEAVVETLLAFLKDDSIQLVRIQADVGTAGTEASGNTRVKTRGLGDARAVAARALGQLGKLAHRPAVLQALEKAVQGGEENVRQAAREALTRIRQAATPN